MVFFAEAFGRDGVLRDDVFAMTCYGSTHLAQVLQSKRVGINGTHQ